MWRQHGHVSVIERHGPALAASLMVSPRSKLRLLALCRPRSRKKIGNYEIST
ncbi:hypothetical protein BURPS1106B_0939 [Burkholderia pseudomallei 1106b]|uniref:Uncharacterized protein n=1 Tax=Burkholderia pseudomallei 1710a TaxID=320371 RepID=A0A0E1VVL0_BURPE|nr:hypothetical protein GBP346_B0376 [Burkholderia pseudomallei MSHR346]EES23554.1 hypothetical protein BURPS1106B_0939 [Burkholderia pseudomallei 1106b]EET04965.1 hypothetical protein BURPS1710A_A0192 [Burkholderia pseudomallei 1710a]